MDADINPLLLGNRSLEILQEGGGYKGGNISSTSEEPVLWMVPLDNSTEARMLLTRAVILNMNMYGLPIIILVGVLGNSMSFIVFTCSQLCHQSSSVYLAFLNFADCLFLLCLLVTQLEWYHVFLLRMRGVCQLVVYFSYVSAFLSVWTVVSFTVERFIVVYFPLMRLVHCTRRRAAKVVICLLIVTLVLYSFALWTHKVQQLGQHGECMYIAKYMTLMYVASILDTIMTMAVPSLSIIILNVLIIVKVWKFLRRKWRNSPGRDGATATPPTRTEVVRQGRLHSCDAGSGDGPPQIIPLEVKNRMVRPLIAKCNSQSGSSTISDMSTRGSLLCCVWRMRERTTPPRRPSMASVQPRSGSYNPRTQALQLRTTRTLLMISSLFVILNLPSHAFRIWVTINPPTVPTESLLLLQLVVQFLYYLNFSINLFMYCACSKIFRGELKCLLLKAWNRSLNMFWECVRQMKSCLCGKQREGHSMINAQ